MRDTQESIYFIYSILVILYAVLLLWVDTTLNRMRSVMPQAAGILNWLDTYLLRPRETQESIYYLSVAIMVILYVFLRALALLG